jgi:alpha-galactosidase
VAGHGGVEIWVKPLHDGSEAIGIFNRAERGQVATFSWSELGRAGPPKALRDLWAHRDLAPAAAGFSGRVAAHGVIMLRAQ